MNLAAGAFGFVLTFLTLLGVPLTGLLAGAGAALTLALAQGSVLWAAAALVVGVLSEGLAFHFAGTRGGIAEALSFVVFGRVLGPWLGAGAWWLAADPAEVPAEVRGSAMARAVRVLGILAVLACAAAGMRG
jgi:hypothetical protein